MSGVADLTPVALYCAAWTIWLAVPHTEAGWKDIASLLDQSAFRVRALVLGVGRRR